MRRAVLLVVWIAGCGRISYGPARDAGARDASTMDAREEDAAIGDAAPSDAGLDAPGDDAGGDDAAMVGPDAPCSESPCRLVSPQCGCPVGQMCTRPLPASAERGCRPAGSVPLGSACTFSVDCTPGTGCIRANGFGICASWCAGAADCPAGSPCVRFTAVDSTIGACEWACDPSTGAGCAPPGTCYLAFGEEVGALAVIGFSLCAAGGSGAPGDTCATPWDCGPGTTCEGTTCRAVCDLDAPACASGTCQESVAPAEIAGMRYGVCR